MQQYSGYKMGWQMMSVSMTMEMKKEKNNSTVTCANNRCTVASVPNLVLIKWMNNIMCQVKWNFSRCYLKMSTKWGAEKEKVDWINAREQMQNVHTTNCFITCTFRKATLCQMTKSCLIILFVTAWCFIIPFLLLLLLLLQFNR